MTIKELHKIHQRYQSEKPKLFLLVKPDPPATEEQINTVESEIGVLLPSDYRAFLADFGGGMFGFTNVFSGYKDSDFFLPCRNKEASKYLPGDLLAFSDDQVGGFYVFKVLNGKAQESIYYWNSDGGLVNTDFADLFEFVARYAYEPA